MRQKEFDAICDDLTIFPLSALENEKIRRALLQCDDDKVRELLRTEFR